ncbi:MAG TPA: L-lactate permease [Anaerolineales bacterium]
MLLDWIFSALPIVLILLLMVGMRWGAAKAGPAGWFAAMLLAAWRFGAGLQLLAMAQVKALLLTLDVLLIIWAAFLLFRVADEAGGIGVLARALPRLTADRGMQALLIGWAFASFLQGVGGFGVPTAVTAPILVGLGFPPLAAVVVPSLGHAWSVTFGSLGSSFQALMASSGLAGQALAPASAGLLGLACFGSGITAAHAAAGGRAVRQLALTILLLGSSMAAAQYLAATQGLWNLAGFLGGLAGLVVGTLLARRSAAARNGAGDRSRGGEAGQPGGATPGPSRRELMLALSGYLALVALTLVIQLVEPVGDWLGGVVLKVPFPELSTTSGYVTPAGFGRIIAPFRHGGAILGYSALVAYLLYLRSGLYSAGAGRRILSGTLRQVLPSSLGIAALVAMAVVMAHAGMTEILARGLATGFGGAFALASPWIGALGAFMTGSNTNSNVLFGLLQTRTAELLGYSLPVVLAAQTAGGAVGSIFAPTKIVVGASTAGMAGQEGLILRRLLLYCLPFIGGLGLVTWAALGIFGG